MIEWDKRTCHNPDQKNGCTFYDCDDCKYFYNDYEMDERGIGMIRAYDDYGNVIDMVEYEKQIREEGKYEGRREAIKWVRKLIHIFWKDWNKQTHKRLSTLAFDELDEWIMEQADESNGREFMKQIKQIEGFYGKKGE